ncbi:hypothetical protein GAY30_29340 [Azospirillum brasilense]|nr:hypothetical protein [Azospirillum brasilense]NUB35928.1 hypothetical protein [Azospirillum brasilense]RIV97334.1 hypothetical protein D2T81_29120 [Azospirillum brasilense]
MVSRPSRPIAGGPFPSAPDPKAAFRKKCRLMKKALAGFGRAAYNPAPTTPGPLRSAAAARDRQKCRRRDEVKSAGAKTKA